MSMVYVVLYILGLQISFEGFTKDHVNIIKSIGPSCTLYPC